MTGLQKFFFKIFPIITLICFVSIGIMNIFNNENLTYLSSEYIDKDTGQIYTNPTNEQRENSYHLYTFDVRSYANNIDQDVLARSIENTLDIQTYNRVLGKFNEIWDDGYQLFDGVSTIINVGILIVDTLILPINIVITPLRLCSGILLTCMSLIGININANTTINTMLNGILDYAIIPLIRPTYNNEEPEMYVGRTYKFNDYLNSGVMGNVTTNINVNFTANNTQYTGFYYNQQSINDVNLYFIDTSNNQILVYHSNGYNEGQWYYDIQEFTITNSDHLSGTNFTNFKAFLSQYTTDIT